MNRSDSQNTDSQPFPRSGMLSKNTNFSLTRLKGILRCKSDAKAEFYVYVLSSVEIKNGCFVQKGCGPNFQGDCISLCTCKHQMRSRPPEDGWRGVWIAGFTSRQLSGNHALFYLMRVGSAFTSHFAFWHEAKISERTKQAKSASSDRFGDIYRPVPGNRKPFQIQSYRKPIEDHCHRRGICDTTWGNDIRYRTRSGTRPAMLIGERSLSFLWTKSFIPTERPLPRDYRRLTLTDFLTLLKSGTAS